MALVPAHITAGFRLGRIHCRQLAALLDSNADRISLLQVDPVALKNSGIAAIAIDFDGVLAPHGFATPLPESTTWLSQCAAVFGEERLFVLSNKPTEARNRWFQAHFPSLRFISNVRKKPFPDGLQRIADLSGVPVSTVAVLDDRLLTGCLAAINAGARPCHISRPYISLSDQTCAELFFWGLRLFERLFIRICCIINA